MQMAISGAAVETGCGAPVTTGAASGAVATRPSSSTARSPIGHGPSPRGTIRASPQKPLR
jgi:hypothetical protein